MSEPKSGFARLERIPRELVAVADYEPLARGVLDPAVWAYVASGAADGLTQRRNRADWEALQIVPRPLRRMAGGNTRCTLFGHDYVHPLLLAPIAYQQLVHPDGELATMYAASALGAPMVVSSLASRRFDELAAAARAPWWFRLYWQGSRAATLALLQRAQAAGCAAVMVTVDAPIWGVRNAEQRAGFVLPESVRAVNLEGLAVPESTVPPDGASRVFDGLMAGAPDWDDVAWLRDQTSLPLLLKGILHPDDAMQAAVLGLDGVVVSNHGGRTLDTTPTTAAALEMIAERLAGRIPVLVDGGITRGSDVFKALALGASAVLVGRAWLYGLAAAGALGVAHVLRILHEELEATMALAGCARLPGIGREALYPRRWGEGPPEGV